VLLVENDIFGWACLQATCVFFFFLEREGQAEQGLGGKISERKEELKQAE
jgi:hypothetical protein